MDAYDAADRLSERLLREYPDGFFQLIIAKHGLAMPTAERRARISASTRRFDGKILAIAMVFEGGPMWVSSMRVVANTMMMVIPSSCPRRMFGDVPHAVAWLAERFPRLEPQLEGLRQLGGLLEGCPGKCACARSQSLGAP